MPLQVTVRPPGVIPPVQPDIGTPSGQQADPYSDIKSWLAPAIEPAQPQQGPQADPYADIKGWLTPANEPPAKEATPQKWREVSGSEAAGRGLIEGITFGAAPAIAGLVEASGVKPPKPEEYKTPVAPLANVTEKLGTGIATAAQPIIGGAKLIYNALVSHPDPTVREAYDRGRTEALNNQKLAADQHQIAYLAGQLTGAIATPAFGAGGGVARSIGAGMIGGGLFGAGTSVSEGKPAKEVVEDAGKGALTGGAFGAVGHGIGSVIASGAGRAANLWRGAADPQTEAARRVVNSLQGDFERFGPSMTPEQINVANQSGFDRAIIDAGQARTREIARQAADISPEGRQIIEGFTGPRVRNQNERVSEHIRNMTGAHSSNEDRLAIEAAARAANRPAYNAAYQAGDRPLWSPMLERLASSDAVERALGGAMTRGRNRAVLEGYGGFNPRFQVTQDGRIILGTGNGIRNYPNLQFWDYAQRELRDAARAAERQGRNEEAATLFGLHTQLNRELDHLVPQFGAARSTAARFFGADNALEAGQNFVSRPFNAVDARRELARFSPAERALFARGFAADLADKVFNTRDAATIIGKAFIDSNAAREKIALALGPGMAREIETLLRVETLGQVAHNAIANNSHTFQRFIRTLGTDVGLGTTGAAVEATAEGEFSPRALLAGAVSGMARRGIQRVAHGVDERVAEEVARMLVSPDHAVLQRGIQTVANNAVMLRNLRETMSRLSRVMGHDIGPVNASAAVLAVIQNMAPKEKEPHDNYGGGYGGAQQPNQ